MLLDGRSIAAGRSTVDEMLCSPWWWDWTLLRWDCAQLYGAEGEAGESQVPIISGPSLVTASLQIHLLWDAAMLLPPSARRGAWPLSSLQTPQVIAKCTTQTLNYTRFQIEKCINVSRIHKRVMGHYFVLTLSDKWAVFEKNVAINASFNCSQYGGSWPPTCFMVLKQQRYYEGIIYFQQLSIS